MRQNRLWTAICFASFFVAGICTTLLGSTFQNLTARYEMPLSNAGIFTTLMGIGATIAVIIAGRLLDRLDVRYVLCGGPLIFGSGVLVLGFAPNLPLALFGTLLFGLGFGTLLAGPNFVIATIYADNAGSALNALNFFYGLGAITGPQLVAFSLRQGNFVLAYAVGGIAMLLMVLPFAQVHIRREHLSDTRNQTTIEWQSLLPFVVLLFFYIGTEVGFGSWIFSQVVIVAKANTEIAALATSAFWAGLTGGRAAASFILQRIQEKQLLQLTILLIAAGTALLLVFGTNATLSIICAFIVGFGCAPVFPTTLAIARKIYPTTYGAVSGVLIGLGNLGTLLIPWLQGQVGGGTSGGMQVILVLSFVMFAIAVLIQRQERLKVLV